MTTDTTTGDVPAITFSTPHAHLPQFLTVEEWRSIVRLSRSAVYAAVRTSHVRVQRFGRTIRIPRGELLRIAKVRLTAGDYKVRSERQGLLIPYVGIACPQAVLLVAATLDSH